MEKNYLKDIIMVCFQKGLNSKYSLQLGYPNYIKKNLKIGDRVLLYSHDEVKKLGSYIKSDNDHVLFYMKIDSLNNESILNDMEIYLGKEAIIKYVNPEKVFFGMSPSKAINDKIGTGWCWPLSIIKNII